MWILTALLVSLLNYSAAGMNADVTINLIYKFVTENRLKAAVAMTCWKTAGNCLYNRFVLLTEIKVVQSEGRHVKSNTTNTGHLLVKIV
jgi:hypothetical protein